MNNLLSESIQGAVRHALLGVFVWLAAKGWITNDLATQLVAACGAGAVIIIWSVVNKYKLLNRAETALGMPQGSTPAALDDKIATQK
jgi:hypothetical protein